MSELSVREKKKNLIFSPSSSFSFSLLFFFLGFRRRIKDNLQLEHVRHFISNMGKKGGMEGEKATKVDGKGDVLITEFLISNINPFFFLVWSQWSDCDIVTWRGKTDEWERESKQYPQSNFSNSFPFFFLTRRRRRLLQRCTKLPTHLYINEKKACSRICWLYDSWKRHQCILVKFCSVLARWRKLRASLFFLALERSKGKKKGSWMTLLWTGKAET